MYAAQLRGSRDNLDQETYNQDYISDDEWQTLGIIKKQLKPLYKCTKDLEGNATLQERAGRASYGTLWELLPVFDFILNHFKQLEIRAKRGEFNNSPRIQSLIILAWNKTSEYYQKTDASIAWMAAVVLHPRWK
jgi:hypothetical protein